ncbi:queuosine salvage family protein [Paenibacillus wynnii]|uniref:queuosine salvage family protein n=1 Tax=Paenibacillus wynnii TaxID=268407 RepID=UPI00278E3DD5|nr:queuosine salvage family protein [Paenibacillus wynnii]MDQ0193760.1 hypothetical protein [Paenibacillus wynnii]
MLEQIIKQAYMYTASTSYVHIEKSCLEDLSSQIENHLRSSTIELPLWNGASFAPWLRSIEEISQFFFIGNSINFRFWNRNHLDRYSYGECRGSEAMWKALSDWPELLDADVLANLNEEQFRLKFGAISMTKERVASLREVGNILNKHYDGKVIHLLERACFETDEIVKWIVTDFPMWNDSTGPLLFYKRAQLFTAMLAGRLQANSFITGLQKLTLLADYHLPKGLHNLGVLRYDDNLKFRIDNSQVLPCNCREELELRASTICVGDLLVQSLSRKGIQINAIQLDAFLWEVSKKVNTPYHLTVTSFY